MTFDYKSQVERIASTAQELLEILLRLGSLAMRLRTLAAQLPNAPIRVTPGMKFLFPNGTILEYDCMGENEMPRWKIIRIGDEKDQPG